MENIGDEWHRATAERVGRAVAAQRKQMGMTAQQLAERCKELGVPIHRTTITKIENGRPRFDLGELIVLAAALDTAPVALLYPSPYDDATQDQICSTNPVDVLPGMSWGTYLASQWFSALLPWTEESPDRGTLPASRRNYGRNVRALRKAREIAELHHGLLYPLPEEGESLDDFVRFQNRVRDRIRDLRAELADMQSDESGGDA